MIVWPILFKPSHVFPCLLGIGAEAVDDSGGGKTKKGGTAVKVRVLYK